MPEIKQTAPQIKTPLSSPDYIKIIDEGTLFDDTDTWDSSGWTWGGGELIRNIDKPN